jgi:sodium-dependent phosphate cotransporter
VIPLVGAGVLTVKKIFPYTIGANIGTTITAILAAFATLNPVAITIAFSHLIFNIIAIVLLYPLKQIPIGLATWIARITSKSKKNMVIFLALYFSMFLIPLIFIL